MSDACTSDENALRCEIVNRLHLHKSIQNLYFFSDGNHAYDGVLYEFLLKCRNLLSLTISFTSIVATGLPRFEHVKYLELHAAVLENHHLLELVSLRSSLEHLQMTFIGGQQWIF